MMAGKEKENAKWPASYFCRHMVQGVCEYSDERVLLDNDTIKKMMASMAGKPVYVNHKPGGSAEDAQKADGYVFDMFYNECDGWFWSRFTVQSDAGHQAVANGWAVSNAYIPTEFAAGGQYLAVDYQRKITNGEFTHLAIVQNPRYEDAKIFTPEEFKAYNEAKRRELDELQNSKVETKRGFSMFKFFRKVDQETEILNEADLKDSDICKLPSGAEVTYGELKEKLNAAKAKKNSDDEESDEAKKAKAAKEAQNDGATYDVDGEQVTMKDLMNSFKEMKASKKNSADEAEKKEKEEKENAKKKEPTAEEKAAFEELQNAKSKAAPVLVVDTQMDKIARGKERY